jgi:acetyl-CoA carboxylase beta subunit
MRHAHRDFRDTRLGDLAKDLVEDRHERIGALDRETLLPDEGSVEEALEHLHRGQPLEQRTLLRW